MDTDMDSDEPETTVLALTGPPAAGKSTVTEMLSHHGIPCKSTGDAVREEAERRYDDPDEDVVWEVAEDLRAEHGAAGATIACADWIEEQTSDIICVADLRTKSEVAWLRTNVGPTLVVEVDAPQRQREDRYVRRKLDGQMGDVFDEDRLYALREELREREERERPYPDPDVTMDNSDQISMADVNERVRHLAEVLQA